MENTLSDNNKESEELKKLLTWAGKTKNLINDYADSPIKGVELIDIKIQKRDEEEVFINDEEVYEKIRRGNCILSYRDSQNTTKYKWARKGLKKFFDYKISFSHKEKKIEKKLLLPIQSAFNSGRSVYVYLSEKANGENIQISYDINFKTWIIGSKNVTILCRELEDILWYRKNAQNVNKYSFSIEFAEIWFKILHEKIISKNLLEEFIKDIEGYTLIGESVGDFKHQHIKFYSERDIIFYSMVKNSDSEDTGPCLSITSCSAVLNLKYHLSFVQYTRSELIHSMDDFTCYMNSLYKSILLKDVEESGEGAVTYITVLDNQNNEEVVSLAKLKTFDYRFLRKLREKLKQYKGKQSIEFIMQKIESECKQILGEEGDDIDLTSYLKFADFVLNKVKLSSSIKKDEFSNYYASFINEMKNLYKNNGNKLNKIILKDKYSNTQTDDKQLSEKTLNTDNSILNLIPHNNDNIKGKKFQPEENAFNNQINIDLIKQSLCKVTISNQIEKIKNKTYFIINYGLVASGKSFLFEILKDKITSIYSNSLNLMYISSDAYRKILTDKYMDKHPNCNFDKAFQAVKGEYDKGFNKEIIGILRKNRDSSKINIFYIDKNFLPHTAENLYDYLIENYSKQNKIEFIVFCPHTNYPIREGKLEYPFSFNYFIKSYFRLKDRKNHENLDYEKCPTAHYILLSFLSLFKGISEFSEKSGRHNIKLQHLSFTYDCEVSLPIEITKLFRQVMTTIGKKAFDSQHLSTFDESISNLFSYFDSIKDKLGLDDTKTQLSEEIDLFLKNKFSY
jgi:hypothetical protein